MATFCKRRRAKKSTPSTYKITVTGSGDKSYCYVIVDGDKYVEAVGFIAPPGLVITAYIRGGSATAGSETGYIYLDGETVATSYAIGSGKTYEYVLDSDVEITLSYKPTGVRSVTITRV